MDDLILFGDKKTELTERKEAIARHLESVKLTLHQKKSQIYQTRSGVPFLGYKVYPTHRLVVTQNICRFRRRTKKYMRLLLMKVISGEKIAASIQSWLGYAGHADSHHLCKTLLSELAMKGISP